MFLLAAFTRKDSKDILLDTAKTKQ